MKITKMNAKHVCLDYDRSFAFYIGRKSYLLGVVVHDYGVRIMLIWWHFVLKGGRP